MSLASSPICFHVYQCDLWQLKNLYGVWVPDDPAIGLNKWTKASMLWRSTLSTSVTSKGCSRRHHLRCRIWDGLPLLWTCASGWPLAAMRGQLFLQCTRGCSRTCFLAVAKWRPTCFSIGARQPPRSDASGIMISWFRQRSNCSVCFCFLMLLVSV